MNWLGRLYRRWLNRHDPAWKPTGLKFRTPLGYDEAAAVASSKRARQRSATGRLYRRPTKKPADVLPIRRVK